MTVMTVLRSTTTSPADRRECGGIALSNNGPTTAPADFHLEVMVDAHGNWTTGRRRRVMARPAAYPHHATYSETKARGAMQARLLVDGERSAATDGRLNKAAGVKPQAASLDNQRRRGSERQP